MSRPRGQLVLAAAVVVALAFVPMLFAYLQLGYDPGVDRRGAATDPATDARRFLVRETGAVAVATAGEYEWSERETAAQRIDDRLRAAVTSLEANGSTTVAYEVAYNASAARRHAGQRCPSGPNREFGECATYAGIVLQERAGETQLLAAAFDVRTVRARERTEMTVVVAV